MRVRGFLLFIGMIVAVISGVAQPTTVEVLVGKKNYWYQHVFAKNFRNSKVGFFHVSSLYAFYDKNRKEEIMSQSYLTYPIVPGIKLAFGSFYANAPGFSPSLALQFYKKVNDLSILLVPRADIASASPAMETMFLMEFRPRLSETVALYARVQAMTSLVNSRHARSYQSFRVGLDIKQFQFGLALSVDEYGSEATTNHNAGVYLRTELF